MVRNMEMQNNSQTNFNATSQKVSDGAPLTHKKLKNATSEKAKTDGSYGSGVSGARKQGLPKIKGSG